LLSALLVLASVACAVVPIVFFLILVWWFDRYDREPIWLVGTSFLWGAIGAVTLAMVGSLVMMVPLNMVLGHAAADSAGAVFVAPLVEEPMKAMILFLIVWSRHFDNTTDGFVYGAAAGLGFGMTENFLYFTSVAMSGSVGAWMATVVVRTFYSAVMHAVATSIVGASFGFSRFRPFYVKFLVVPIGFTIAMTIHGVWNGLLTADEWVRSNGVLSSIDFLLFPVEFLAIVLVFQFCLLDERATIRRELDEEARLGVMPVDHVKNIASYFKRGFSYWHARNIPHRAYVKAATRLAMRKHQSRYTTNRKAPFYTREVDRLRGEVRKLLGVSTLRNY
jgi:protease PrsW